MSHTHSFPHPHSYTWSQGSVRGFIFIVWIRMKGILKPQFPSNMIQGGRLLIWVSGHFSLDPRVRFDSLSPISVSVCIVCPELLQMCWEAGASVSKENYADHRRKQCPLQQRGWTSRDDDTKWSKSEKDKYHMTSLICEILKWVQMNWSTKQK